MVFRCLRGTLPSDCALWARTWLKRCFKSLTMIHLISLEIVWLLFSLWQNTHGHTCIYSDNWLKHRHIIICIHKFDLFYMNVEFTRKGAVKSNQNCTYSYFEIVLSFNFITLNSCGITAVWIYYVFFTQRITSVCWVLVLQIMYIRLICSNKMTTAYKR